MNSRLIKLAMIGLVAMGGVRLMAEDFSREVRKINAQRVATAPVVDGEFNEETWKGAEKQGDFRLHKGSALCQARTEVMTCWSGGALYIAMVCCEPDMNRITRKYVEPADRFTWKHGTDEIALFIVPEASPEKGYFHFTVGAGGEIYHKFHERVSAKSFPLRIYDIKAAVKEFPDRWQVEIEIPFKELVYPDKGVHARTTPANNDKWLITFARFSNNFNQEWSSWNAGTYHCHGPMGELVFLDSGAQAQVSVSDNMEQVIGRKDLKVTIKNLTDKPADFIAMAELAGMKQEKTLSLASGEQKPAELSFALKEEGLCQLDYSVFNDQRRIWEGRVLYDIVPAAEPVRKLVEKAEVVKKNFPEDKALLKLIAESRKFIDEWDKAVTMLDQVPAAKWSELARRAGGLVGEGEALIEKLNNLKVENDMRSGLGKKVQPEYGIGIADNMMKVRPDDVFQGAITNNIIFSMARNEHENRQIVVLPFDKKLKNVRFKVSNLAAPGGIIPFSRVKISPIGLVGLLDKIPGINGRPPKDEGLWPDPIMEVETWDCEAGKLQSFWLDVETAFDQPAGTYKGAIEIVPENSHALKLQIEVRVWDFGLPERNSLKVDYWFHDYEIHAYYRHGMDLAETKKYAEFLGKYRMPLNLQYQVLWENGITKIREPDGSFSFDFAIFDKYLKICHDNGLNVFNLNLSCWETSGTLFPVGKVVPWRQLQYYDRATGKITRKEDGFTKEESEKLYFQFIKSLSEHLKKLAWFDYNCVVYNAFDECAPKGEKFELMKRFNTKIKEMLPDVPRTFAMNGVLFPDREKAFRGYVEMWIPVIERITKEQINELKKQGQSVWWYTMGYPQWPDYFINQDGIDHLIIPWLNWKFGVDGVLRCSLNSWPYRKIPENEKPDLSKLWLETPWRKMKSEEQSCYLFYPGPDGNPWPSIRLEMWRNGMEDYEYFRLLSDLVKKNRKVLSPEIVKEAEALLDIPDSLVKDQGNYLRNPNDYLKYRENLGNMIEKISISLK